MVSDIRVQSDFEEMMKVWDTLRAQLVKDKPESLTRDIFESELRLLRASIEAQDLRIAETRAAALEEAAKMIQAMADEHSTKGRDLRGGYSDRRFYAVMGAKLNESAAAIRALIPREG
jgi:hypothetical protein